MRRKVLLPLSLVLVATLATSGCGSIGSARISGFQPIDPPVAFRLGSPFKSPLTLSEPIVDSLQPTLKWEGLPGRHERHIGHHAPFVTESEERITNLTFELEVYEAEDGTRATLAYRREGLVEPQARIETPLKPGQLYLWSVRASFLLDGQPRKSEWSLVLWQAYAGPSFWRGYDARDVARITGRIPDSAMYRFRTPEV